MFPRHSELHYQAVVDTASVSLNFVSSLLSQLLTRLVTTHTTFSMIYDAKGSYKQILIIVAC